MCFEFEIDGRCPVICFTHLPVVECHIRDYFKVAKDFDVFCGFCNRCFLV